MVTLVQVRGLGTRASLKCTARCTLDPAGIPPAARSCAAKLRSEHGSGGINGPGGEAEEPLQGGLK